MKFKKIIAVLAAAMISASVFAFEAETFWREYKPSFKSGSVVPCIGAGLGAGEAGFNMKIPPLYGIVDVYLPIADLLGNDHTSTSWYFDIGFLTGAHYFLNDSFGFFGELGYGFSFAKLGVSFKF